MSRRTVQVIAGVALLALPGCRDRSQHREPTDRVGQPERGRRMLAEAGACAEADPPPLDRCTAACDLGHSNSCARAGDATGQREAALALYRRACGGGSGLGCESAGLFDRARFYLRVHCQQKDAASCAALARLFEEGRGGSADPGAAATFRRQACQLGDQTSCQ